MLQHSVKATFVSQLTVKQSECICVESFVKNYHLFSLSVEGLHAIVVTDRDGVPVIKGKKRKNTLFLLLCISTTPPVCVATYFTPKPLIGMLSAALLVSSVC